jgi:hypothetical protein
VVHLDLRLSPRIFEKIRNGPNAILWGWGEADSQKNQKQKISLHCPFKCLLRLNTFYEVGMVERVSPVLSWTHQILYEHSIHYIRMFKGK